MTEEQNKSEPKLKKTTIKELGPNLAVGISDGSGNLAKAISVRPWRFKEEKELGELRDENSETNIAQYVSMVLSTMCTQIGNHDFNKLKFIEKRVSVGQMWMGDVFEAYIWLRIKTLGNLLSLDLKCPNCKKKIEFIVDLLTTEVATVDKLEDSFWEYELKTPITIRGKKITKFLMGPARWIAIENLSSTADLNTGLAKASVICGSIQKTPEYELGILVQEDLDELEKIDIETLTAQIDKNNVGPDMSVEAKCKRCKTKFVSSINWNYDDFFGVSSRS